MRAMHAAGVSLVLMLSGLGAAGCDESPTSLEDERLVGRWEWVRATGGIAGVEITPVTEGYTLAVRYLGDSTVEVRRDGELRTRTSYEVVPPSSATGARPHRRILYDEAVLGSEWQYLVSVDGETLIVADPCCDRYEWELERSAEDL